MKFIRYNIKGFIVQYLGRLFGKTNQQKFIYSLLYPLEILWNTYNNWRVKQYYLININAQVFSIQNHLNDTYDPQNRNIEIISREFLDAKFIAKRAEQLPFVLLPKRGEVTTFEAPYFPTRADAQTQSDFTVIVPNSVSDKLIQIKADIRQFKTAGKQFTVQIG